MSRSAPPDLHALTVEHDPGAQADLTLHVAAVLLAAGLDPARSILAVQSHLPDTRARTTCWRARPGTGRRPG